ncbi:MAG TPA: dockerin, partial [Polyangia bacterium]
MKKTLVVIVIAWGGWGCGGGASAPTKPKLPAPAWDWAGVIGTGQSLSVGVMGNPETRAATTPMFNNLKLSLGALAVPPIPDPASSELSMVPLVEPIRTLSTGTLEWPLNIFGETPHTAMADAITALYQTAGGADYVTAHTVVGESGKAMQYLQKGAVDDGAEGRAYAASMFEVQAIHNLAVAAGKTYGVGAVVITHGEADSGNPDYESELAAMQADYTTDVQAITGQTEPVLLLVSQQNSVPNMLPADIGLGSISTLAQWQVGLDHPGLVICAGPKYQYPYFSDGVHLITDGY